MHRRLCSFQSHLDRRCSQVVVAMVSSSSSSSYMTSSTSTTVSMQQQQRQQRHLSSKCYPEQANIIIIGGGIIGASVAYHLSKLGKIIVDNNNNNNNNNNKHILNHNDNKNGTTTDILLLEQSQCTSGTTWHAAGLINTFGSLSATSTYMRQYTKELYAHILPQETGLSCGYMPVGFIELACDHHRVEYYRRVAAFNRYCGVQVKELSSQQIHDKCPIIDTSDVLCGFYVPDDGRANPTDVTMALLRGAKTNGVQVYENTAVAEVITTTAATTTTTRQRPSPSHEEVDEKDHHPRNRILSVHGNSRSSSRSSMHSTIPRVVTGVTLSSGEYIQANIVVNCAGMWARQLGEQHGVTIPNQAAEHYYLITEPLDNNDVAVDPNWPIVEDSSKCVYIRPEGRGLMLGLFERTGASWNARNNIPQPFSFGQIPPDIDRIGPYLLEAMKRVPITEEVGTKLLFCGPESFTPDGNPIVGESSEIRNYYVAAGMNSLGILTGGGIGKILAQWILDGCAPGDVDVTAINVTRFHKSQNNISYREERVGETLGNTYKVHFPSKQPQTCRGGKRSALHDRLAEKNAYFRDVSGWESPAWYATDGHPAIIRQHSFHRENWFEFWSNEHHACRNNVVIFDGSFHSKFLVMGIDAGEMLNRLSTANVNGNTGIITYTQWLNERGYMEADVTVTKLDDDSFLVIATDTQHNQVATHIRRQLAHYTNVTMMDVTGSYCQINLQGPNSRLLLQQVTSQNLSNAEFPFRRVKEIDIGYARVLCARITYMGELGYELYIPTESAIHVYEQIINVGASFDLKHAGLRALGSLRLEKGYRDYGHDMDNTDTIFDVGLGFTCDFDKPTGFIGQGAVLDQKQATKAAGGQMKRMAQVLVTDEEPLLHGGEILWRNGKRICDIRSASYAHTLGGAIGLCMLKNDDEPINKAYVSDGDWTVEVGNKMYPCTVSLRTLYDPKNEKIKV